MNHRKTITIFLVVLLVFQIIRTDAFAAGVPEAVLSSLSSVVRIFVDYDDGYSTGSGFVIANDGSTVYIATNNHVIEGDPNEISVRVNESSIVSASVVKTSEQIDLCILELSEYTNLRPLSLSSKSPSQGDAIYAVGFPGAADAFSDEDTWIYSDPTITDGIVSALRRVSIVENGSPIDLLQISAAINHGNSGGPLFDAKGNVVGINTYSIRDSQGIFGAIAVSELISLMDLCGIQPTMSKSGISIPTWAIIGCIVLIVLLVGIQLFRRRSRKNTSTTMIQEPSPDVPTVSSQKEKPRLPKKKIKIKKSVLVPIILLIILGLLAGGYWFTYQNAVSRVESHHFSEANKYLLLRPVTALHDHFLLAYIDAGMQYENKEYKNAADSFEALGDYRESSKLMHESQYYYAGQLADSGNYEEALIIYNDLDNNDIFDCHQDQLYCQAACLMENGEYLEAYDMFSQISTYKDASLRISELKETLYNEGVSAYQGKDYDEVDKYSYSAKCFITIDPYKESDKYLTLLDARRWLARSQIQITTVDGKLVLHGGLYDELGPNPISSLGQAISELNQLISFEDASIILLLDNEIAWESLSGNWMTKDGSYYFRLRWGIASNLPGLDDGDQYKFKSGDLIYGARKLAHFEFLTETSVSVYCYTTGQTFTLFKY